MTCIIGIIEPKRIVFGCDSLGSNSRTKRTRKDGKVFLKGDMIIGCCGTFRLMNIIEFSFKQPSYRNFSTNVRNFYDGEDLVMRYMCTVFISELKKCFKENGFLRTKTDDIDKGGQLLIGFQNRIFEIGSDFQVAEFHENYASIGSGYSFAMGSLSTTVDMEITVEDRICKALESAEKFDLFTQRPFHVKALQSDD